jgi:hypothetical protein
MVRGHRKDGHCSDVVAPAGGMPWLLLADFVEKVGVEADRDR